MTRLATMRGVEQRVIMSNAENNKMNAAPPTRVDEAKFLCIGDV